MNRTPGLVLLAPLVMSGCLDSYGPWESRTEYSAVWSDDGLAILVARLDYEERTLNEGSVWVSKETRDKTYELTITGPQPGARQDVIASGLRGWSAFYFMKSAGYILVDSLGALERQEDALVDLDTGEIRPIDLGRLGFDDENTVELLPSPDGATIAAAEVANEPDPVNRIRITWFDPRDGARRFEAVELPYDRHEWFSTMRWRPDHRLEVETADRWFEVDPQGSVRETDPGLEGCAPTTSSRVNAEGQEVLAEQGLVSVGEPGLWATWACL